MEMVGAGAKKLYDGTEKILPHRESNVIALLRVARCRCSVGAIDA